MRRVERLQVAGNMAQFLPWRRREEARIDERVALLPDFRGEHPLRRRQRGKALRQRLVFGRDRRQQP